MGYGVEQLDIILYPKISVCHYVRKTWTNGRDGSCSSLDLMLPFLGEHDGLVDSKAVD